jgi:hypothetical protein
MLPLVTGDTRGDKGPRGHGGEEVQPLGSSPLIMTKPLWTLVAPLALLTWSSRAATSTTTSTSAGLPRLGLLV